MTKQNYTTDETQGEYQTEADEAMEMLGKGYEPVRIKDESRDKNYFTITPRIVWAMCDDPFEYTLWCVIKDIAGERGVCILAREDLAVLSMMSGGKLSECRDSLIAKGLLNGLLVKDPGYPKAVWHFTIPDLWEDNIQWAKTHLKISSRVEYKKSVKGLKDASRGDGTKDPSCGEKVPSRGANKEEGIKEELINNNTSTTPNIFQAYENEIGMITSFIADDMTAHEKEFSTEWIMQAIHIAAENNKRSWGYVKGVLKSAKEKGMSPELTKKQMAQPKRLTPAKSSEPKGFEAARKFLAMHGES